MKSSSAAELAGLPVTGNLTLAYVLSLVIAVLMTSASVAGLLYPDQLYPTEELQQSFMATDVVNLFIGLPILLGSMWFARRGKLIGLLFWPRALFYVLYHYIVYAFALSLNWGFLLSLLLLTLSAYTMTCLVASIDGKAIQQRLSGNVSERIAGGALTVSGITFALLAIGTIANGIVTQTPIGESELALQVSDFIVSVAWIIGGALLWRREPLGYVVGAGLLFQASMLFVGLIAFFILQPFLTAAPFALTDTIVIALMGLIVFIPFGLFLRGAASR